MGVVQRDIPLTTRQAAKAPQITMLKAIAMALSNQRLLNLTNKLASRNGFLDHGISAPFFANLPCPSYLICEDGSWTNNYGRKSIVYALQHQFFGPRFASAYGSDNSFLACDRGATTNLRFWLDCCPSVWT